MAVLRWQACRDRIRAGESPDAGIGLILVLGYAVIITIILTVSVATVSSLTKSSRSHISYGQAVDSAEAGIDQTLARLAHNANYATSGVTVPTAWTDGFPDPSTERTWVLNSVTTALATQPSLLQKSSQGEFAAIRPTNAQTIYSVGWEPSRANPSRIRVLRNDYMFSGYSPSAAILTQGNVAISGSFSLASNAGTALPPNVHSEGTITSCSSSVSKPAGTTIDAVGGGCGGTGASQTIPKVDPRGLYDQLSNTYAAQWYDLCVISGVSQVRSPSTAPCTGTVLGSNRGWSYDPSSHTWSASSPYSGIYYAYQANINLTGVGAANVTVITEAQASASCPLYGDVYIKQTQLTAALPFVGIYAGGNVSMDTQSAVGTADQPALVGAAKDLDMHTSSAPGVTGAAIANNICGGTNNLQGSAVTYDANMTIRSADLIRSTTQTELN
jgi:hypothetical protein